MNNVLLFFLSITCLTAVQMSFCMNPSATALVAWARMAEPAQIEEKIVLNHKKDDENTQSYQKQSIVGVLDQISGAKKWADDADELDIVQYELDAIGDNRKARQSGMREMSINYPIKDREKKPLTIAVKRKAFAYEE